MMDHGFTQLTPELWVRQSQSLRYNTGVFISGGEAELIDPGLLPDEFAAIRGLLEVQRAQPVGLTLTHSHWDHVLGPEQFPGVPVLAQAEYPAAVARDERGILREIARWEAALKVPRQQPFSVPQPHRTFAAGMTLAVGGTVLRLAHTPGHAADQLVFYHAAAGALWASDFLSDEEIPFVSDNLAAYERSLAMLASWDIRVLVPGHGAATADPAEIQGRLTADRAYLAELRERVTRAVTAGRSVAETVADCADMAYRHRAENEIYHGLNVESAYLELGGQADPQKVGWGQDWEVHDAA